MGIRSIVWYCGKSWEPWGPKSLEKGIAGSQSAVIHLSREWAKLGLKVKVYNNCEGYGGIYDGVEYIPFRQFNERDKLDIFIIWRDHNLDILDNPLKAKKVFLDLHDAPYRKKRFSQDKIIKIEKIFTKSTFHYKHFINQPWAPYLKKGKFTIIPNGADERFFNADYAKEQYRLIYNSNYERGLEPMLEYGWPIIKGKIPQAELHVYFGWGFFDTVRRLQGKMEWKRKMIALIKKNGVIDHGRVKIDELIEGKARSAIHYYGCTWNENDCISVRESALAGCVPITTKYSALAEKKYCIKVSGDPKARRTQQNLACKVVKLLENPKKLEKIRKRCKRLAAKDNWENIAKLWLKEFNR